jgi:hypothetical protein
VLNRCSKNVPLLLLVLLLLVLPLLPPAGYQTALLISMRSSMRALLPLAVLLLGLQLAAAGRQSRSLLNTPKDLEIILFTRNQFLQVGGPHSMLGRRHCAVDLVVLRMKAHAVCDSCCCTGRVSDHARLLHGCITSYSRIL